MRPRNHSLQRRELQLLGHRIGQHIGVGDAYSGPGWQGDPRCCLRDEERGQLERYQRDGTVKRTLRGGSEPCSFFFLFWGEVVKGHGFQKGGNKNVIRDVTDQEREAERKINE